MATIKYELDKKIVLSEMPPLLKVKYFTIHKPYFDANPSKSLTKNHEWRQGLFVVFSDGKGNKFIYMPLWHEIEIIRRLSTEVDIINSDLARQKARLKK